MPNALICASLAVVCIATPAAAQRPATMGGAPAARWIADSSASPNDFGVYHFRRVFDLSSKPDRFVVNVSADNRYRLVVNGQPVSSGPQRSDLAHWRYETVDLAPALRAGRNVLAATVWNWGVDRPVAQESRRSGFLLQGTTEQASVVSTGRPGWRVLRDVGYAPLSVNSSDFGYYAASPGESLDAKVYPWGWEDAAFIDAAWPLAGSLELAQSSGTDAYGVVTTWQLVPRSIPPMEETTTRFSSVRRAEGITPNEAFLRGAGDLVVPPRTRVTLLLDQGFLTTAYVSLETSDGAGAILAMLYAEALVDANGRKGNRAAVAGKRVLGIRDEFKLDGGAHRRFRTLWFRAYRFVQLDVQTADEPLIVHEVHGVFTAYPYVERGRFASDAAWIDSVWAMNWRTARVCANETYFDTPYYEQLQYVGDTRIQALISLYVAGDDRLVRNAIEQFDWSRTSDGLTASRYPSALPQYIPPFSLIWVMMLHDYWMLRDDPAFVRRFLPGIRGVLGWFDRRIESTGLVRAGETPWWGFVDWAPQWERGVPPGAESGYSVAVNLQYVYALELAAKLESALGARELAAGYRARATSLRAAVRARAWDQGRRLFRDAPDSALFSQQTNVLAVLAGAVPVAERRALVERVLADTTLVRASYYFTFYVLEALREVGLGDRYVEQLAPWRQMLAMGFTTTPEAPEPSRSDSHAWSAHPNYGLLATVLGVRPNAPGFRTVLIEPHLGPLIRAEGRVPHPRGDIDVSLTRVGAVGLRAVVTLPTGVSGTLVWRGRRTALRGG
ncbi:MAG TPA: alpha-L-rhamnosidase C-terminal domain-containing protein, partial [Gemmatimonadaceae bacterium]|nr:alpha-L-rhamnosidase C-terminal domain-containing protein [Gemmatimonadaceae bacterium]